MLALLARSARYACCLLACSALTNPPLWAADAPRADDAPRSDAAANAADPLAEFNRVFGQFKELLGRIRALQGKYQLAGNADRGQLEAQFNQLVAEGKKLAPQVVEAAKAAYQVAPENNDVSGFLFANLADAVRSDRYDDAVELAKLLRSGGFNQKGFANLAGIAEFCTNDYEAAARDLQRASKEIAIDKTGEQDLKLLDEYAGYWEEEQKIRAKEAEADDLPRVKFTTTKGDIVIELFENEAPNTVANFISLVEKHFYDGLPFHRVLPGFMAQGGDPKGNGSGGPGYTIACECYRNDFRKHFAGTLSMAHAGRDTGGSQFFLTFVPTAHLNGKHTAFGRVIDGMGVVASLQRIDPDHPGTNKPDKIVKAVVLRKRAHAYEPKTGPAR